MTDGPVDAAGDSEGSSGGGGGGSGGIFETVHEGSTCQATIEGLRPNFRYEFRVTASNSVGASVPGPVTTVVTEPAPPGPTGAVTAAVGRDATADTVFVTWWGSRTGCIQFIHP
jgi:hypothetical protein